MARVKTFILHQEYGVHDKAIAEFVTECETDHYVSVNTAFIPFPTPRFTVIVTKLDTKDESEKNLVEPETPAPTSNAPAKGPGWYKHPTGFGT